MVPSINWRHCKTMNMKGQNAISVCQIGKNHWDPYHYDELLEVIGIEPQPFIATTASCLNFPSPVTGKYKKGILILKTQKGHLN